jgi:hypothetical protein
MKRVRFSIASLLGLIVFVGIAAAALREATDLWDAIVFDAAIGWLTVAVLLAVHQTDRRRAFWLGFALVGATYMGASLVPAMEARLLSTKALAYLDTKVPGRSAAQTFVLTVSNVNGSGNQPVQTLAFSPSGSRLATSNYAAVRLWNTATGTLFPATGGTSESFVRIGHALVALVMAFVGAHASRWLYDRGRRAAGEPAPTAQELSSS